MKGFLIGFLIFLIWASGGIYYLHSKPDTNPYRLQDNSTPTVSNKVTEEQTIPPKKAESPPLIKEQATDFINIDEESSVVLDDIPDAIHQFSEADHTVLLSEIKKSIAVSTPDTIANTSIRSKTFYPHYERTELILDNALKAYATELHRFLKAHPEKKVTIVGHTDNIGNAMDNFQRGLRKSRQVKWYFTQRRGIPAAKITAMSRGEAESVSSNQSVSGRAKNNRIEIIIN